MIPKFIFSVPQNPFTSLPPPCVIPGCCGGQRSARTLIRPKPCDPCANHHLSFLPILTAVTSTPSRPTQAEYGWTMEIWLDTKCNSGFGFGVHYICRLIKTVTKCIWNMCVFHWDGQFFICYCIGREYRHLYLYHNWWWNNWTSEWLGVLQHINMARMALLIQVFQLRTITLYFAKRLIMNITVNMVNIRSCFLYMIDMSKVSANEIRRYNCDVRLFSHWLKLCSP